MYEPERQTTTVRYDVTDDVETVAITAGDAETTVERRDDDTVRIEATNYAVGQTDLSGVTVTRTVTGSHLDVGAGRTGELTLRAADGGVETISVGIPEGVRVTDLTMDDGDATVEGVAADLGLTLDDGTSEIGPLECSLDVEAEDAEVTVGAVDRITGALNDGTLTMTAAATLGDVRAEDGDLSLAADGTTIRAADGQITLRLSPSTDMTVVARTDDGTVQFADDLVDAVESAGGETRGRIGDGSSRLTVETDDGAVVLEPL